MCIRDSLDTGSGFYSWEHYKIKKRFSISGSTDPTEMITWDNIWGKNRQAERSGGHTTNGSHKTCLLYTSRCV